MVKESVRKKWIEDNDLKMNVTTIFIVPMLEFNNSFLTDEFISAYIDYSNNNIVMSFENSDRQEFMDIVHILQKHNDWVVTDYEDDNNEIVIVFNIPVKYKNDFNAIMNGLFSKISKEYREILLDYHGRKTGAGKCIYMIDALMPCHATKKYRADKLGVSIEDLPGGEVMSIPDKKNEEWIKTSDLTKEEGEVSVGK